MVLTRIKGLLIKLVGASLLLLVALSVQGHPGRTDSEGCHVGKLPRHCHGSTRSDNPAQGGKDRLEAACQRALTLGSHSYKSIESILRHGLDRQPLAEQTEAALPEDHDNIRGPAYYH